MPALERLSAISRTNQRELLDLWGSGAGSDELQTLLFNTSDQADVRILVVDTSAEEIVFDTADGDNWVGDALTGIERPQSLVLTNVGRGSIFGSFVHTNGSRWLVFAEPTTLAVDMVVQLDIDAEERTDTVLIPAEALIRNAAGSAVFVAVNSRAERRLVMTGLEDAARVEITSGLRAGELVITRGHVGLSDGAAVTVAAK